MRCSASCNNTTDFSNNGKPENNEVGIKNIDSAEKEILKGIKL